MRIRNFLWLLAYDRPRMNGVRWRWKLYVNPMQLRQRRCVAHGKRLPFIERSLDSLFAFEEHYRLLLEFFERLAARV